MFSDVHCVLPSENKEFFYILINVKVKSDNRFVLIKFLQGAKIQLVLTP